MCSHQVVSEVRKNGLRSDTHQVCTTDLSSSLHHLRIETTLTDQTDPSSVDIV